MLFHHTFLTGLVAVTSAKPIAGPVEQAVAAVQLQAATLCAQYAYYSSDGYEFNNNLWGKDSATSGSQCTSIESTSSSGVKWSSTWTWWGSENNVKSYVYAGKQFAKGLTISKINSMPTNIQWSYDGSNVRANVAYDIFTAQDPNHDRSSGNYEIMIWLARIGGVYPIGSKITTVNVAGRNWDIYSGPNGSMKVFSFLPTDNSWLTNFNVDVKQFFNYLNDHQGFPASQQNLIVFQQGTEAFTGGPATYSVPVYSVDIKY